MVSSAEIQRILVLWNKCWIVRVRSSLIVSFHSNEQYCALARTASIWNIQNSEWNTLLLQKWRISKFELPLNETYRILMDDKKSNLNVLNNKIRYANSKRRTRHAKILLELSWQKDIIEKTLDNTKEFSNRRREEQLPVRTHQSTNNPLRVYYFSQPFKNWPKRTNQPLMFGGGGLLENLQYLCLP